MLFSHDSRRVFVRDEATQKLILPVYKHGWSTERDSSLKKTVYSQRWSALHCSLQRSLHLWHWRAVSRLSHNWSTSAALMTLHALSRRRPNWRRSYPLSGVGLVRPTVAHSAVLTKTGTAVLTTQMMTVPFGITASMSTFPAYVGRRQINVPVTAKTTKCRWLLSCCQNHVSNANG